jgi:hypothetical protein
MTSEVTIKFSAKERDTQGNLIKNLKIAVRILAISKYLPVPAMKEEAKFVVDGYASRTVDTGFWYFIVQCVYIDEHENIIKKAYDVPDPGFGVSATYAVNLTKIGNSLYWDSGLAENPNHVDTILPGEMLNQWLKDLGAIIGDIAGGATGGVANALKNIWSSFWSSATGGGGGDGKKDNSSLIILLIIAIIIIAIIIFVIKR